MTTRAAYNTLASRMWPAGRSLGGDGLEKLRKTSKQ
jgi:hypothetical protein